MGIGGGLFLIALGAVLRFAIATPSWHGIAIHTIGVILMIVGVVGLVLWLLVWGPWSRRRRVVYRRGGPPVGGYPPGRYPADRYPTEESYEDDYRP